MSAFKAQAHARELTERLKVGQNLKVEQAVNADGMPILKVSALSGSPAYIKIETDGNAGRVNGLNLPQQSYSPHIATLLVDNDAAAVVLTVKVAMETSKLGMKVKFYNTDTADLPATILGFDAALGDATLQGEMKSDAMFPLTLSQ